MIKLKKDWSIFWYQFCVQEVWLWPSGVWEEAHTHTSWSLRTNKELLLCSLLINESIQRLKSNCCILVCYALKYEGHKALYLECLKLRKYWNFENEWQTRRNFCHLSLDKRMLTINVSNSWVYLHIHKSKHRDTQYLTLRVIKLWSKFLI